MNATTTTSLAILGITFFGTIAWLAQRDAQQPHAAAEPAAAQPKDVARPHARRDRPSPVRVAHATAPRRLERSRWDDEATDASPAPAVEPELELELELEPPAVAPDSVEQTVAAVAAAFDSEPVDTGWAAAATGEVERVAYGLLPEGSRIEEVSCRGSMCRLTSVQRDEQSARDFSHALARSEVCSTCLYAEDGTEDDGRPRLVVYLARQGSPLPLPES